jgi:hypothetical protein
MQLKALLTWASTQPQVRNAIVVAATEVAARGLVDTIEYMLDRTAYVIAKNLVEHERNMENT